MKKNIKKLFVVSGVVLSTSVVLQQFTLEQVRAEEIRQFNNEKVTNVKLEKSALSREEFIKAVIKENKENGNKITSVYLHKLGSENLYKKQSVKLEDLDAELPQNISFVTINGEKISGGRVVFVDKEDEIINTEEEYNELFKKYGMEIGKYKKVHTSANIKIPVHLSNSFAANGLFWGETSITAIINNHKIYTQYIGLSCDYANFKLGEPLKVTCDLASYKKNDENIHEFIKAAGIDENDSDEEKVVKLSLHALNNIPYGKYSEYAQNSSIFSLATRKTSMCVGFSLGISRALNLMGIPAYMVSGHSGAGPHATVRAYYNNQWHTIDATANGSTYNRESFYRYVVDSYDLYDGVEKVYDYSNGRLNNKRYMSISREYEKWAKEQKTEDLVIVNKDAIIKRINTVQISNELKQNLLERYELLIKNYDNLKTYLEKQKDEKSGDFETTVAIIKSIEHSEKEISNLKEKLNQDDKLFLEEYKKYDQDLRRHYGFLEYLVGQTERIGFKFYNSNNDRKEKELSEKAIELLKQHNLSEKELKEVEKTKLEQEEAEKLKQEQELAKQEEAKKEEQRRQEELAKKEEQRRQEEMKKQEETEKLKQEQELAKREEQRRQEEMKKQEEAEKAKQEQEIAKKEEQRRQEELKKQEEAEKEEQRRQEELKKQEEAKKEEQRRQEELKKQEEAKKEEQRRQEELKKQEEAKKEEQRRQEELKKQEEAKKEEQRRQEELKKQEEAKKEEQRRQEVLKKQEEAEKAKQEQEAAKREEQRRQEELKKQEEAEKLKQEAAKKEEQRRQEEMKKQEEAEKAKQEEQRRQEELKKQEEAKKEEQRRQEELKKQEEAKKEEQKRQEEMKKQEEAKKEEQRRQEELKKQEAKKEEQRRQEELKKQEEAKKEEQRRQEEMKKQEEVKKEEQRRQEEIKKQETDKEKDTNTKETQKQEKLKFEKSKEQHSEINKLMKLEHSAEVKDNTETKEQKKLSNTGENTQSGMYGLLGLFMSIFAYFKRKNN